MITLRVQGPNNHILTPNLYYSYYYPKPKYLIIGYMDPLGSLNPKPLNPKLWNRQSRSVFANVSLLALNLPGSDFRPCFGV